jgi:electron transfer flavoprotein alpha subunit
MTMDSILVLTHVDDGGSQLTKASLEAVTAGKNLADSLATTLTIGILGSNTADAANALAATGARFLSVSGDAFAQPRYASDAAACEALYRVSQASIVLAPESSRFARILAGVSHRVGGFTDSHITAIKNTSTVEVTRWFYRQRMEAVISRETRPWFLLLDAGTHPVFEGTSSSVQVEKVPVALPTLRTTVCGQRAPMQNAQTIRPDAKLLFVAGAGWTKKQSDGQVHIGDAEKTILGFLHLSGASLGSSKSLVDQRGEDQSVLPFMTHLNQIGQTGATPRHLRGLSTCCHGEEPHVVGWRFITERRAISLDANCGWTRGKADVVYVADAFHVMTKVNALLSR